MNFALDRKKSLLLSRLFFVSTDDNAYISTQLNKKEPTTALRFRAGGFATLRKKLGLSAEQMGKLINVSAQSVYHWETKKSRPRASQLTAIAAARKLNKRQARAKLGI